MGADSTRVLEEIKVNFTTDICSLPSSFDKDLTDELIAFLAERDEELLNLYLEGQYDKALWINQMKTMIKENRIYPCTAGSALLDQGIAEFLENLHRLTETNYEGEEFTGTIYKIAHEKNGTKITYIKLLSGSLKVRDEIRYPYRGDHIKEKITQIRKYNGERYQTVDGAHAGQIIGVTGLSRIRTGQGLGNHVKQAADYDLVPALKSKILFASDINIQEIIQAFRMLEEEDPSLKVMWEEELQELQIHVMGPIQLEILKRIVQERFAFTVKFEEPSVAYKETINDETLGYGHFEPLGHYAEVHLKIEAGVRNSGIVFQNYCHPDELTKGNQNLVKQHLYEKEHRDLLTGSPLTDLKITLLTGRAHNQHTSGGDFRQATYRALRQGLEKADIVLLEPYYDFKIKVDVDYIGKVLSDIQKASGTFEPPQTKESKAVISGRAPVSTFMNYPTELVTFTSGKGIINLVFGGYDLCHNQQEVIEKIGYDKNADPEYSSSSIFCSKGQAYEVCWQESEKEMHCS